MRARTIVLSVAAVIASGAPAAAQQAVERGWPLNATGAVRIYNLAGSVEVNGWDRDSLHVSGTVSQGARLFGGGSREGVKVVVEGFAADDAPATLVVRVPRRARVWVKSADADVAVSGVAGDVDAYTVGGRIRIQGNPRAVTAEAMNGDVEIDGAPAWLRAKTASGAILQRGGGDDVALTSVSGSVAVSGGTIRRGRLESVTGDLRFAAALERGADLVLDSHSGAIDVLLPRGSGVDALVTTVQGTIRNALTSHRPSTGRDGAGEELAFASGSDARLTIRSFKGTVTLRSK